MKRVSPQRRIGWLVWLGIILALQTGAAPAEAREAVTIAGNEVFEEGELRHALGPVLKERRSANAAEKARRALTRYYHKRGYTLARVFAKVHQGTLYISIEEGKLEKVLVLGPGSMTAFLMRLMFNLPHAVYNQERVAEELERLKARFNLTGLKAVLVESPKKKQVDFQLSDIGPALFPEQVALYELRLVVGPEDSGGASIGLYTSSEFGLVPYIRYGQRGPFFPDRRDRYRLSLETGYNLRQSLADDSWRLLFTHARLGARYDFPPLWGVLRFFADGASEISSYQRPDLPLDGYWHFLNRLSGNAGFQLWRGMLAFVGGGYEFKQIFSIDQVPRDPFPVQPFLHQRWFLTAGFDHDFSPDEIRLDRHHLLGLSADYYRRESAGFTRLNASYQKVFGFAYNDLALKARALGTIGNTPFYDEAALGGEWLRTFFQGRYFVDNAGWLSIEYRLSLWRDIIKISIFHDLALFGRIDRPNATQNGSYAEGAEEELQRFAAADAFGPGFHWLILDAFQLDAYMSFGFAPAGFGYNYYLRIYKVF